MNYLSIIEDYILRPKTNYALMINGEWGNGKTYFVENTVFPRLQEIGYKPIKVTLNGINRIDEINKQIYLATSFLSNDFFKNLLEKKATKYVSQLAKIALTATSQRYSLGTNDDYKIDFEKLINLKNIVLCFDDLERCRIDIVELLGYINNFVEHDDVKTIIIGNEKEIKDINIEKNHELKVIASTLTIYMKQNKVIGNAKTNKIPADSTESEIKAQTSALFNERKQFDVVKEKLIGKTILYKPDYYSVIGEIIKDYTEYNEQYFHFLKGKNNVISSIHEKSNRHNLRIIKQSLSDFLKVFSLLNSRFNGSDFFDLLVTGYFIPALILSIEHKEGRINLEDLQKIESTKITQSLLLYKEIEWGFYNKYLDELNFDLDFFHSTYICKYIVTSILEEEKLLDEAQIQIDKWSMPNIKTSKSSLHKLMDDFLELENDEFMECIQDVLDKLRNGQYDLYSYERTFNYFEKFFMDLISINMEELLDIFEKGIKRAKLDPNPNNEYFNRFFISNPSENQLRIQVLVKEKESELRKEWLKNEIDSIFNLLPENVEKFVECYCHFVKNPSFKEVFQFVNIQLFYEALKKLSNRELQQVRYMFSQLYNFANIYEFFESDYANIIKLIECFSKDMAEVSGVRKLQYQVFITNLEDIAMRLKHEAGSV